MVAWLLVILAWRDLRLHTLALGLSDDGVTVTAFVGNQMLAASIPSIRLAASAQSARVPSIAIIRTGIPNASTAKCSFVLIPLWCDSFPGFLPAHPLRAGEPCSDWRRSSAIHNPAHQSIAQAKIPTHPCRASDKIADAYSSSRHSLEANCAMASLCAKSRTLH